MERRGGGVALRGCIGLGMMGALVPDGRCLAQGASERLTVRPRTVAMAGQTPEAGAYPLDSVPDAIVTVPPQCVGARRCPLLVQLPGWGYGGPTFTKWLGPAANKYGFLLLASSERASADAQLMDTALREVFRRFAIDPDKIAIMGRCASGERAVRLGLSNPDLFSRIGAISGGTDFGSLDLRGTRGEFFLDYGILEIDDYRRSIDQLLQNVRTLRASGHPVTLSLTLRNHDHQVEDYDFLGHWFQETWTAPAPTTRPAPVTVPETLLPATALTQMAAFWTRFLAEPDSIKTTARRAHLREVVVPLRGEPVSTWITDMLALAARYPSVAADLQKAGLTADQHEAYRIAFFSAYLAWRLGDAAGTVDSASVLGKNVAFLAAHEDELGLVAAPMIGVFGKGMWGTP